VLVCNIVYILQERACFLLFFVSFSFMQLYEVSEAVDQWKMLALDSTLPEWKCDDSRKAHPARVEEMQWAYEHIALWPKR